MTNDELDSIPGVQVASFPQGVTEVIRNTEAEIRSFVDGLDYPDNIDVCHGAPFERDGQFVVRVCVGDW